MLTAAIFSYLIKMLTGNSNSAPAFVQAVTLANCLDWQFMKMAWISRDDDDDDDHDTQ